MSTTIYDAISFCISSLSIFSMKVYNLPVSDAAKILNVTEKQVRNFIKDHKLFAICTKSEKGNKKWLLNQDDVKDFAVARDGMFEKTDADGKIEGNPERELIEYLKDQNKNLIGEVEKLSAILGQKEQDYSVRLKNVEIAMTDLKATVEEKNAILDYYENRGFWSRIFNKKPEKESLAKAEELATSNQPAQKKLSAGKKSK